jgi:hypothetical protein
MVGYEFSRRHEQSVMEAFTDSDLMHWKGNILSWPEARSGEERRKTALKGIDKDWMIPGSGRRWKKGKATGLGLHGKKRDQWEMKVHGRETRAKDTADWTERRPGNGV